MIKIIFCRIINGVNIEFSVLYNKKDYCKIPVDYLPIALKTFFRECIREIKVKEN